MRVFLKIYTAVFVLAITCPNNVHAGPPITGIDPKSLDELIHGRSGRYVLVTMAAWCAPCKKELPILNRLYSEFADKGLKIIGISLDVDGPRAIQSVVDQLEVQFPVYWAGEEAVFKYNLNKIPMLLFAKEGKVMDKLYGSHSEPVLREKIEAFLRESSKLK